MYVLIYLAYFPIHILSQRRMRKCDGELYNTLHTTQIWLSFKTVNTYTAKTALEIEIYSPLTNSMLVFLLLNE